MLKEKLQDHHLFPEFSGQYKAVIVNVSRVLTLNKTKKTPFIQFPVPVRVTGGQGPILACTGIHTYRQCKSFLTEI